MRSNTISHLCISLMSIGILNSCAGNKTSPVEPSKKAEEPSSKQPSYTANYLYYNASLVEQWIKVRKDVFQSYGSACKAEAAPFSYMKCLAVKAKEIRPTTATFFPLYAASLTTALFEEKKKRDPVLAVFEFVKLMDSKFDEFTLEKSYFDTIKPEANEEAEYKLVKEEDSKAISEVRNRTYRICKGLILKIRNRIKERVSKSASRGSEPSRADIDALERKVEAHFGVQGSEGK